MSPDRVGAPPFPPEFRASGLLLHVTSLPSRHGIGDLGAAALPWIDRLAQAGQRWWQMLPLGPTGFGNSPYQSSSSFAGNELLISPDWLIEDQLLRPVDIPARSFPQDKVDYLAVIPYKQGLIDTAWAHFNAGIRADLRQAFEQFRAEEAHWLDDYALFISIKNKFGGAFYLNWPSEFVIRQPATLDQARIELKPQIDRACFAQFLFFRQTDRLKAYAHKKGVTIVGDLPFYVSPDSSDVWAEPELFLLDENHRPRVVAGVPPDYFSELGQLWGNPIYDWDKLRESGYHWCVSRLQALLAHMDVIRLDHFRAFAAAWHVPATAPTAQTGKWVAGPGAEFLHAVEAELGTLPFIAEDLGAITPDVYALRDQFRLPGMRVLQFAFDGKADNPHLPSNYNRNTIVYTGTHDNTTTRAWYEDLPEDQRINFWKSLNRPGGEPIEAAPGLMKLAWASVAAVSVAPLQDVLNLEKEARMNTPGRAEGNWDWRCTQAMLDDPAFNWLLDLTKSANRSSPVRKILPRKTLQTASKN